MVRQPVLAAVSVHRLAARPDVPSMSLQEQVAAALQQLLVQYEPKASHRWPSARTIAGSMAFQESVVPEVKAGPWSVQVPGRPDGDAVTSIASWLTSQEETTA
ncbi:hypothetical protein [Streptomyces sp. NPDC057623]|uniref:hypothetical protein n=1 Tax=Streptomyces sp. NPDC057623 TaxID=3346187 RepID=UPI0036C752EF